MPRENPDFWHAVSIVDGSGSPSGADAFAYEAITVAAAAIGLTAATYAPTGQVAARRALITAETAQMRFRYGGVDPTAAEGHLLEIGQELVLEGAAAIANFRAIRTTATSGTLRVSYER